MAGWVITAETADPGFPVPVGLIETPADPESLRCGWINPFRGWVLMEAGGVEGLRRHRPQALRVYAGEQRVGSCQCGLQRPDLMDVLIRDEALEAGFEGHVYVPAPFDAPLRLVAVLRDGRTRPFARWDPENKAESAACVGYLDRRALRIAGGTDLVEVAGWALIPGRLTQTIQVFLDGHPALECKYLLPRPDVARRFSREPQAGMSGFRAIFPERSGLAEPQIRVEVTDQDGRTAELF